MCWRSSSGYLASSNKRQWCLTLLSIRYCREYICDYLPVILPPIDTQIPSMVRKAKPGPSMEYGEWKQLPTILNITSRDNLRQFLPRIRCGRGQRNRTCSRKELYQALLVLLDLFSHSDLHDHLDQQLSTPATTFFWKHIYNTALLALLLNYTGNSKSRAIK
jgi:hypothetical protein